MAWGLRGLVTVGLCVFLFRRFDLGAVRPILANLSPAYGAAALLAALLANVAYALAPAPLFRTCGVTLPTRLLIRNQFLGMFFSLFLPTAVGGDVARVVDLSRGAQPVSLAAAASMVLVQRLLALLVAVALVAAAMPGHAPSTTLGAARVSGIVLLVMLVGAVAIALTPRRWIHAEDSAAPAGSLRIAASRIHDLLTTRGGFLALLGAAAACLISQLLFVAATWLLDLGLGVGVDPIYYVYVVPLAAVAVTAPVSINGIGIREGIYIYYLGQIGISAPNAAAVSISLFLLNTLLAALGGLAWASSPVRNTGPATPATEAPAAPAPEGTASSTASPSDWVPSGPPAR